MTDVAYFIGAGILKANVSTGTIFGSEIPRRTVASGVTGYDFDACWHDYRKASFAGFSVTVVASMLVQQTERSDRVFSDGRSPRQRIGLGAADFFKYNGLNL